MSWYPDHERLEAEKAAARELAFEELCRWFSESTSADHVNQFETNRYLDILDDIEAGLVENVSFIYGCPGPIVD